MFENPNHLPLLWPPPPPGSPLLRPIHLSCLHSSKPPSLARFEAIFLALYTIETKSYNDKPLVITIPNIYHASLRQAPNPSPNPHHTILDWTHFNLGQG
ncbi:hypothetical protein AAZX31_01G009000 [Glycine max]